MRLQGTKTTITSLTYFRQPARVFHSRALLNSTELLLPKVPVLTKTITGWKVIWPKSIIHFRKNILPVLTCEPTEIRVLQKRFGGEIFGGPAWPGSFPGKTLSENMPG